MPKFFLNLQRVDKIIRDIEGQEFASVQDALRAAEASLCEIAADSLQAQCPILLEAVQITNASGEVIETVATYETIQRYLPHPQPSKIK
jgi:hypothetical protein